MTELELELGLKKSSQSRAVAELKLQAALLCYQANRMQSSTDWEIAQEEVKIRSQIHSLQDIILDSMALQCHYIQQIQGV